ncbi:MAG: DUF4172 domain-containing protein [Myxococcaceae bacterium]
MSQYIHEIEGWPHFQWRQDVIAGLVASVRHRQGRLLGRMENLGFSLQQEASLESLTLEVVKSSEIEGDMLDASQVRSSLARRLGMDVGNVRQDRADARSCPAQVTLLDPSLAFLAQYASTRCAESIARWV